MAQAVAAPDVVGRSFRNANPIEIMGVPISL
jgi:hypothetical protein